MQKTLIILGMVIFIVGVIWPVIDFIKLGRLPGDIILKKNNFTFYFPIVTSIIISLLCSLIIWLVRRK